MIALVLFWGVISDEKYVVGFTVSMSDAMGCEAVSLMMSEPDWGMDGGLERLVIGSSGRLV